MMKRIMIGGLTALLLTACESNEVVDSSKVEPVVEQIDTEPSETVMVESEPAEVKVKTEVTFQEFDGRYTRDPDEKQYINGVFILKDGTTASADYISYIDGDIFDYASVIFYKGKLAHIQMETTAPIEEIETAFGMTFGDNVIIDPNYVGFEIIFDETFADENIHRFPFELD
jgi:hypothetical protein